MLVSSINLLSKFTHINFSNLFTPLYANQQSENSEFIILKSRNTETSIYISKGAKVKIDRNHDTKFNKRIYINKLLIQGFHICLF